MIKQVYDIDVTTDGSINPQDLINNSSSDCLTSKFSSLRPTVRATQTQDLLNSVIEEQKTDQKSETEEKRDQSQKSLLQTAIPP